MIVQAIGLLDDLDKELNTYAMRVREWFGWHFPEMTKIVTDNIQYAKTVSALIQVQNPMWSVVCMFPPFLSGVTCVNDVDYVPAPQATRPSMVHFL